MATTQRKLRKRERSGDDGGKECPRAMLRNFFRAENHVAELRHDPVAMWTAIVLDPRSLHVYAHTYVEA